MVAWWVRAWNFRRCTGKSPRSASWSMAINPALCRVFSYLSPGLPRPTTSQVTGSFLPKNMGKTPFCFIFGLCHNKQLINSHFYRGVSELPYKLLFAVIYTHLEFRYEVSHTITSHHVHHFHQTRIPDGTLLDYMV